MEIYLKKQLLVILCVYLGSFVVGVSVGWSAPVIPILQDPNNTPLPDIISNEEAAWVGSLFIVGLIIGPFISGYFSGIIGRKPCFFVAGIIIVVGYIILALSINLCMLYVGRVILGFGFGAIFTINLVYIGEIASTNIRGILLTGTGIAMASGTLGMYCVGPYVPYVAFNFIICGFALVYCIGTLFLPESPVYYVLKGREKEAKASLESLGRTNDIDEVLAIKQNNQEEKVNWLQLFTVKSNRKALFITLFLCILQHLSGFSVLAAFITTIFELVRSTLDPNISTIIIGLIQLLSSTVAPLYVERFGRKILLLISTGLCCISTVFLGIFFYLDHIDNPVKERIQWLPLLCVMLFMVSYNSGYGIIPGTFIGEMFEANARSLGSTVSLTVSWLFGFIITSTFGYMISSIGGYGSFWIFSAASATAFLFTAVFVPETKGKTLYEIQTMLSQ